MSKLSEAGKKRRLSALIAALEWVGQYETEDMNDGYLSLEAAFEKYKIASRVKSECSFPDDMVDAFAVLRRMVLYREREASK